MTGISQEVAENGTILRAEVGSVVHGLSISDTSDRDEMGVCIEPAEFVIGLRHFEQFIHRTQPDGVRSGPGDLDLTVYSLRKFCSLALKGNPTILSLLFIPKEQYLVRTFQGDELIEMAWAFASRHAGRAFLGYMQQQRQRLTGIAGNMRVNRPELISEHGYDTKYAGHILRLGFQGIDYMTTGRITIPMPEEPRQEILAVRRGERSIDQVMTMAGELEAELKDLLDISPLPDKPDHVAVNAFLISQYQMGWRRRR